MASKTGVLLFMLLLGSWCRTVYGTPRFYPDVVATSANGRFQFAATSPENANGAYSAFQTNFTYKLIDVKGSEEVWERSPQREPSPCMAFVDNDGRVIVVDAIDEIKLFDIAGKSTGKIGLLDAAMTANEVEQYVHDTTAGPMWKWMSRWYFFTDGHRDCFVIRPYWGRRIVIDLETVLTVHPDRQLETALDHEESDFVDLTLRRALKDCRSTEDPQAKADIVATVDAAIQIAGQRRPKANSSLLRQLEAWPLFDSTAISVDDVRPGEIAVNGYSFNSGRRRIQLALRRMGELPAGYSVTVFSPERANHDQYWAEHELEEARWMKQRTDPRSRAQQASKISNGMSPQEVIRTIGPPDFVDDNWQYDLDGPSPSTLIITWTATNRVRAYWQARPALWELDLRDDDL